MAMSRRIIQAAFALACGSALVSFAVSAAERKPTKLKYGEYNPAHQSVEMFEAIEAGQIEVKLIQKDSTQARVLIENKGDEPLNVKLPEVFGGVPVLAQRAPGAGGGAGGGNSNSNSGSSQNQSSGGGFGGGGGGFGGGGGGGFFNVAPEKVANLKVASVCLEHGKDEPRAAIPYKIVPLKEVNDDPALAALLKSFANGDCDQRTAQAAAWHITDKMSWDELTAKQIHRLGGQSYPYFSQDEIRGAMSMVSAATIAAEEAQKAEQSPSEGKSPGSEGKASEESNVTAKN